MAHIDWIAFHSRNQANGTMRLTVDLKPSGNVSIDVPLPEDLHAVIMKIAQTAADAHEAQMHAEILGERYVRTDVPETIAPQAPAEEADSTKEAPKQECKIHQLGLVNEKAVCLKCGKPLQTPEYEEDI